MAVLHPCCQNHRAKSLTRSTQPTRICQKLRYFQCLRPHFDAYRLYYLYGLLVKVPCGTWGLLALVVVCKFLRSGIRVPFRDEIILLSPALLLLIIVSLQTSFNIHLRYVFPALSLVLISLGQAAFLLTRRLIRAKVAVIGLISYSIFSAALAYPHHLAYFNDFVGGSKNGYKYLLGSSLDWGQDLFLVKQWVDSTQARGAAYQAAISMPDLSETLGLLTPRTPFDRMHFRVVISSLSEPQTLLISSGRWSHRIGDTHVIYCFVNHRGLK